MDDPIVEIRTAPQGTADQSWITALEAGKILYFPSLGFDFRPEELQLLNPDIRDPKRRNISLDAGDRLKGANGDPAVQQALAAMMGRFRTQAEALLASVAPAYTDHMRRGLVSFRPMPVATRVQSWRADDRRMHLDAFPSRPNRGERLLRVFTNVNPFGEPRVWRVGQPFEQVVERFLPQLPPYSAWRAKALNVLGITKSLRSEYDHLMLQLHDAMKADHDYQQHAPQVSMPFAAGATWVCFSDQSVHAVMSGQYLLEQTMLLPPTQQYDPDSSPLAILSRATGRGVGLTATKSGKR